MTVDLNTNQAERCTQASRRAHDATEGDMRSDQINELVTAMAKAQVEFEPVVRSLEADFRTKQNVRIRYRYADLAKLLEAVRQPLANHGVWLTQTYGTGIFQAQPEAFSVTLYTTLFHSSGQWIVSTLPIQPLRKEGKELTPIEIGSYMTYMRKYAACAILGIAPEDDDGQAASGIVTEIIAGGKQPPGESTGKAPPPTPTERVDKITRAIRLAGGQGMKVFDELAAEIEKLPIAVMPGERKKLGDSLTAARVAEFDRGLQAMAADDTETLDVAEAHARSDRYDADTQQMLLDEVAKKRGEATNPPS